MDSPIASPSLSSPSSISPLEQLILSSKMSKAQISRSPSHPSLHSQSHFHQSSTSTTSSLIPPSAHRHRNRAPTVSSRNEREKDRVDNSPLIQSNFRRMSYDTIRSERTSNTFDGPARDSVAFSVNTVLEGDQYAPPMPVTGQEDDLEVLEMKKLKKSKSSASFKPPRPPRLQGIELEKMLSNPVPSIRENARISGVSDTSVYSDIEKDQQPVRTSEAFDLELPVSHSPSPYHPNQPQFPAQPSIHSPSPYLDPSSPNHSDARSPSPLVRESNYQIPPRGNSSYAHAESEIESSYETDDDQSGYAYAGNDEYGLNLIPPTPTTGTGGEVGGGREHGRKKSEVSFEGGVKRNFSRPFGMGDRNGSDTGLAYAASNNSSTSELPSAVNQSGIPLMVHNEPQYNSPSLSPQTFSMPLRDPMLEGNENTRNNSLPSPSPSPYSQSQPLRKNSYPTTLDSPSSFQEQIKSSPNPNSPNRIPSIQRSRSGTITSKTSASSSPSSHFGMNKLKSQRSFISTDGSEDEQGVSRSGSVASSRSGSSAGRGWRIFGRGRKSEKEKWEEEEGEDDMEELDDGGVAASGEGTSKKNGKSKSKKKNQEIQRESVYSNYSFYELPTSNPNAVKASPRSSAHSSSLSLSLSLTLPTPSPSSTPLPLEPPKSAGASVHFASDTISKTKATISHPSLQPTSLTPQTPSDFLSTGIKYHEAGELERSAWCFERSAKLDGGIGSGMLLWGLTLRHGWGVAMNQELGFKWLQKVAEGRMNEGGAEQGGRVEKALSYYELAANLGDPDAQQQVGFSYLNGKGCKVDKKKAAKYYRMAVEQGVESIGLSWIYKEKYQ